MTNANVALLQLCSGTNIRDNLAQIEQQIKQLPPGIQLVVTPENALLFSNDQAYRKHAEQQDNGPLQQTVRDLARRYKLWLLLGSMPLFSRENPEHLTTSSLLYNSEGELQARYDKIHLFDVDIADSHRHYCESDTYHRGQQVVVVDTPIGKLGMTICYDLRFPGLFQQLRMKGAEVIIVPAAFTRLKGKAHWEVLLRARAIETQCFVLAPAQVGRHSNTRRTWGHSLAIDPWGKVIAKNADAVASSCANIDRQLLPKIREQMPVMDHNQFKCHL